MPPRKKAPKKKAGKKARDDGLIRCHFISNTHWDREWRYSAARTCCNLVYLLDMLLDIFEREPAYKSFHMDSQTLPIQDYLEYRPEMADKIRRHVRDGRLRIGPWFCLPDEFCVSGEALIRNLLLGHRIAGQFGKVSKTGYSPFSWGQISQMPQIYRGFGIDAISFYRGINTLVAPVSERLWEGPDGSRILLCRLAPQPRYNVWFHLQRPVYWGVDPSNRYLSWSDVGGPFRFIDPASAYVDGQYTHPAFNYRSDLVGPRAKIAIEDQNGHWTTPCRFWSAGHDSSCPDIREIRLIEDCNKALKGTAEVFHSTVTDFEQDLKQSVAEKLPVLRGEMRYPATPGSSSTLIGWIISARTYLKQDNFRTETLLMDYAEPLAVFAALMGAPYPHAQIDRAFNWLLQNHGHDSIAGCSRDIVHEDMLFRSRQSRELSLCVREQAMLDIAGAIDLSDWSADEMAIVVFNPSPFERSETLSLVLDIPREWQCAGFDIVDEADRKVACQLSHHEGPLFPLYLNRNDAVNMMPSIRYYLSAEFHDIPAMGYRTFRVKPLEKAVFHKPVGMLTGPQRMENEHLSVEIQANGTFDLLDKRSGKTYAGLGYFRDSSEIGSPWIRETVAQESVFTTLNEKAQATVVRDGELETTLKVSLQWALPRGRSQDEKSRQEDKEVCPITSLITLRKAQPWVEIVTSIDNRVEDHYLQACFPTGLDADSSWAQGQFDVVERKIGLPDFEPYIEKPQAEQPMNSFVDITDGKTGLALLNEGLKAYTAHDDPARTLSLSLLRCFPLRICAMSEMTDYSRADKGSLCLGLNTFRYAVMPHAGNWADGGVWQAAERFTLPLLPAQMGPTSHGTEPLAKSFLELEPGTLHVSAVKRSESGKGWIVRLFNPLDETVNGRIRLNGGKCKSGNQSPVERVIAEFKLPGGKGRPWAKAREVSLEELPGDPLRMCPDGWVPFKITKKKILTLQFLP